MNNKKVYAVDFDGTLCRGLYPKIGYPINATINYVKELQEDGNKLILWTCRTGELLDDAVKWCGEQGLEFDAVNKNLPENIEKYGVDTRKVDVDYYIDDKNISIDNISETQKQRALVKLKLQLR